MVNVIASEEGVGKDRNVSYHILRDRLIQFYQGGGIEERNIVITGKKNERGD